jgi:hypothetical protein
VDTTSLRYRPLAVGVAGMGLYAGDFLVKLVPLRREPIDVSVPLDTLVPFLPAWAGVYLYAWLLFIFTAAGWYLWEHRTDWTRVRALLFAAVGMQVAAWVVHYAIPTTMPRPELAPEFIESGSLIWKIYATDPPTHVLPSLHMASLTVALWFFCRGGGAGRHAFAAFALVLISLSVMFTKQHGVIDVGAGIVWGWAFCLAGVAASRALAERHATGRTRPLEGA